MSNTIIIALHGGDSKTCCAAICKTADSETCMSQGSIPGSTHFSNAISPCLWPLSSVEKEKECLYFLILSKRAMKKKEKSSHQVMML